MLVSHFDCFPTTRLSGAVQAGVFDTVFGYAVHAVPEELVYIGALGRCLCQAPLSNLVPTLLLISGLCGPEYSTDANRKLVGLLLALTTVLPTDSIPRHTGTHRLWVKASRFR